MKTYEIRCKATGTDLDGNLTLDELQSTLESYFIEDLCLDIDEVIKYCDFQDITLIDYFINDYCFDRDLAHIIDRYEVLDNSGKVLAIDIFPALYNAWSYHWFYDNDCPKFVITDANCQSHVVSFWDNLKNFFNWNIVIEKELMHDLLKYGQYQFIDMIAGDNFKIEIVSN